MKLEAVRSTELLLNTFSAGTGLTEIILMVYPNKHLLLLPQLFLLLLQSWFGFLCYHQRVLKSQTI